MSALAIQGGRCRPRSLSADRRKKAKTVEERRLKPLPFLYRRWRNASPRSAAITISFDNPSASAWLEGDAGTRLELSFRH
jgi:hypothetical protein